MLNGRKLLITTPAASGTLPFPNPKRRPDYCYSLIRHSVNFGKSRRPSPLSRPENSHTRMIMQYIKYSKLNNSEYFKHFIIIKARTIDGIDIIIFAIVKILYKMWDFCKISGILENTFLKLFKIWFFTGSKYV